MINNTNIIISVIYKSPKADIIRFSDLIYIMFNNISAKNDLYLVGDFNINILMDNFKIKYFVDVIYSLGCRPMITRPTWYRDKLNSLIDIFCNVTFNPIRNTIIISDVNYHLPICIIYDVNHATKVNINILEKLM